MRGAQRFELHVRLMHLRKTNHEIDAADISRSHDERAERTVGRHAEFHVDADGRLHVRRIDADELRGGGKPCECNAPHGNSLRAPPARARIDAAAHIRKRAVGIDFGIGDAPEREVVGIDPKRRKCRAVTEREPEYGTAVGRPQPAAHELEGAVARIRSRAVLVLRQHVTALGQRDG